MNSLKNSTFWNFGGINFFYFTVWTLIITFLPLWLNDQANLSTAEAGIVFSTMSVVAIFLEPVYGVIQDKLGLRRHLFAFVVLCLLMIGPYFEFAFIPLLQFNVVFGSIAGGAFLSLCLYSGVGVVEAYTERSSRASNFEYGHARLFGSLAGGAFAFIGGIMFVREPFSVFWVCTISGILLGILLLMVNVRKLDSQRKENEPVDTGSEDTKKDEGSHVNKDSILSVFKKRSFWGLCLLIIGSASLYDVFDQQFPNYFVSFFPDEANGESIFSRLASVQIFMEAGFMVLAPWFINKIGAKNGLILYGLILFVRVIGTALSTTPALLALWKLLAAIEMPLMLVSIMKYIVNVFDVRLSATVYMLGFNVAKQLGVAFFSVFMGSLYTSLGFQNAYIIMSIIVLALVIPGGLLMRSDKKSTPPSYSAVEGLNYS
ncbi:oligosaccharide MFS transporter [Salibacterium halotolerans]|uniref:MFS transporter, OHS family, lactose permease n=1 Tax=Salibacterium halotolerans TaxID=1884432 RepID=A0A1I5PA06_9BACI|nr:oligosaccharide MFS transporter [Salibacterium halotolerans]SFP30939.1 MFS transporter, OHS family, lactose permease [Salibacterium halotolerans]